MMMVMLTINQIAPLHTIYGSRVAARDFNVPESALRSEEPSPAATTFEKDADVDVVELTRQYPQFLVGQTYSPPAPQKILGLQDEPTAESGMDAQRGDGIAASDQGEEPAKASVESEEETEEADESREAGEPTDASGQPLDQGALRQLQELKSRDQEVRTHEQAHKAVGGQYAGGISYEYQQGPDGNRYAVGGEVSIDVSPERDPESTIAKMRQVRAAAMAPADPSPQDRSVSAQAVKTEGQARSELRQQDATEASGEGDAAKETDAAASETSSEHSTDGQEGNASLSSNRFIREYVDNGRNSPVAHNAAVLPNGYAPINVVA